METTALTLKEHGRELARLLNAAALRARAMKWVALGEDPRSPLVEALEFVEADIRTVARKIGVDYWQSWLTDRGTVGGQEVLTSMFENGAAPQPGTPADAGGSSREAELQRRGVAAPVGAEAG